jgi:hypothetical protein
MTPKHSASECGTGCSSTTLKRRSCGSWRRRTPAPPAAAPAPGLVTFRGRQIDPRLLSDPRSPIAKALYRERLAKQSVQRSGILRFRRDD